MELIRAIEAEQLRTDIPDFNVGDTVKVMVKVVEGNRERLQAFEGTVISIGKENSVSPKVAVASTFCLIALPPNRFLYVLETSSCSKRTEVCFGR